jgi:hypothetical protein
MKDDAFYPDVMLSFVVLEHVVLTDANFPCCWIIGKKFGPNRSEIDEQTLLEPGEHMCEFAKAPETLRELRIV